MEERRAMADYGTVPNLKAAEIARILLEAVEKMDPEKVWSVAIVPRVYETVVDVTWLTHANDSVAIVW